MLLWSSLFPLASLEVFLVTCPRGYRWIVALNINPHSQSSNSLHGTGRWKSSHNLQFLLLFQIDPHFDLFTFVLLLSFMRVQFICSRSCPMHISFSSLGFLDLLKTTHLELHFHCAEAASIFSLPHLFCNAAEPPRVQHSLLAFPAQLSHSVS